MKFSNLKQDQGVAGLTILLSMVTLLFVIGLLVMIFSIMGGQLEESAWTTETGVVANETQASITEAGVNLAKQIVGHNPSCSIVYVGNATSQNNFVIANWTTTGCIISFEGTAGDDGIGLNNSDTALNITYTYSVDLNSTASGVAYSAKSSISNVTDWYDIFIVIGAMLVLILLTVIIITAIRGSGLMGEMGSNGSSGNVGSA